MANKRKTEAKEPPVRPVKPASPVVKEPEAPVIPKEKEPEAPSTPKDKEPEVPLAELEAHVRRQRDKQTWLQHQQR
jgi:hypothetical protein